MNRPKLSVGFPRFLVALPFLVLLLGVGLWFPQGAVADEVKLEFTGFLVLPQESPPLQLPPAASVTAQIELPLERGASMVSFPIQFTPQTKVRLARRAVRNGQLVRVRLVVQKDGLVVKKIKEVEVAEFFGTVAGLPAAGLTLPVSPDSPLTVTLQLGGLPDATIPFVVTDRTETELTSLNNGDQVEVKATVVGQELIAVEIEDEEEDLDEKEEKAEKAKEAEKAEKAEKGEKPEKAEKLEQAKKGEKEKAEKQEEGK